MHFARQIINTTLNTILKVLEYQLKSLYQSGHHKIQLCQFTASVSNKVYSAKPFITEFKNY